METNYKNQFSDKEKKVIYEPVIPYHHQQYQLENCEIYGLCIGMWAIVPLLLKDLTNYLIGLYI